ncbi:MAG: TolC family protein [Candidatus Aminicenantes bacterium]|nr:TolC family protein [Candidatus Aminicenantes bacterium]
MKKPIVTFLLVGGMSLFSWPAFSQGVKPALRLEECLAEALAAHPLLRAAAHDVSAAEARVRQAKALAQPSFDLDVDLQPRFLDFRGSGESYVGLSQTFDFPGKRGLRGGVAAREADALRADLDLLKLEIRFQVRESFFRLLFAREILRSAEQDRELARDFLHRAEVKFEAGDIAEMEVVRARVEAAKTANAVRVAENDLRLARARLNVALSRPPGEALEIEGVFAKAEPKEPAADFTARALDARPELRRLRFEIEREKLRERLGFLSYLPDFTVGLSKHRIAGEPKTWDFTLSVPVPLFFWQPKSGEIAEARAARQSLEERFQALGRAIALEVAESRAEAQNAAAQIVLFEREILPQAEDAYGKFLFSYQQGEIGGIELIEARRTLLEVRRSYGEVLYIFNVALAALEKAVGSPLEREGHGQK